MKFKGTKGDWIAQCLDLSDYKSLSVGSLSQNTVIAHCYLPNKEIEQEQKANALLISKAPEMLEAMQEFCHRVDRGEVRSKRTYAKFKELIKSATQI